MGCQEPGSESTLGVMSSLYCRSSGSDLFRDISHIYEGFVLLFSFCLLRSALDISMSLFFYFSFDSAVPGNFFEVG